MRAFWDEFDPLFEALKSRKFEKYFEGKKNRTAKVVVYTAVSGNYDKIRDHKYIVPEWDYVCFSDEKPSDVTHWEYRPIDKHGLTDSNRIAKYYKLLPHRIFPEYDYSLWIDGSCAIVDPSFHHAFDLFSHDPKSKIALAPHPSRDCAYEEAWECIHQKKDEEFRILQWLDIMEKGKYPRHNGLYECGLMLRRHNDPMVIALMDAWWRVVQEYSKRDQMSFVYLAWKLGVPVSTIFGNSSETIRNSKRVALYNHLNEI